MGGQGTCFALLARGGWRYPHHGHRKLARKKRQHLRHSRPALCKYAALIHRIQHIYSTKELHCTVSARLPAAARDDPCTHAHEDQRCRAEQCAIHITIEGSISEGEEGVSPPIYSRRDSCTCLCFRRQGVECRSADSSCGLMHRTSARPHA